MANESARKLRKNMTDTEQYVWSRIRHKQLGGFRFRRQHPIGSFIGDFICLEQRLILELDGGQHDDRKDYDELRTRYLNECGYRVVRYWNHQIFEDWDWIAEDLFRLLSEGATPHPNPPPQGGRGQEAFGNCERDSAIGGTRNVDRRGG